MKQLSHRSIALGAFAFAPLAFMLFALTHVLRQVPMFDDYVAILGFALRLESLPTAPQKLLAIVASQTGDYKLVVEHSIVAADVLLTHRVHFGFLIWAGNLFGLACGWLLWRMFFTGERDLQRRLILFLPIIYLFFQMSYVENFDWAMCGLQTFPVVFFSLACALCLGRDRAGLVPAACLLGCLAAFSSSNGFLLAPIGVVVFASRKQWRALAFWIASFTLSVALYLYRYKPLPNVLQDKYTTATNRVLFFFSFLGSAVENQHRQPIKYAAVFVGVLLVSALCVAIARAYQRRNPAAVCMALWVVLTCLPVLIYRLPSGFQYSLIMRYKIYSDLLLIFAYGFFAETALMGQNRLASRKGLVGAVLAATMLYALGADVVGYRYLVRRQERVAYGLNRYLADPAQGPEVPVSEGVIGPEANDPARAILTESLASGLYQMPSPADR